MAEAIRFRLGLGTKRPGQRRRIDESSGLGRERDLGPGGPPAGDG
jgi:hypothetical protein